MLTRHHTSHVHVCSMSQCIQRWWGNTQYLGGGFIAVADPCTRVCIDVATRYEILFYKIYVFIMINFLICFIRGKVIQNCFVWFIFVLSSVTSGFDRESKGGDSGCSHCGEWVGLHPPHCHHCQHDACWTSWEVWTTEQWRSDHVDQWDQPGGTATVNLPEHHQGTFTCKNFFMCPNHPSIITVTLSLKFSQRKTQHLQLSFCSNAFTFTPEAQLLFLLFTSALSDCPLTCPVPFFTIFCHYRLPHAILKYLA